MLLRFRERQSQLLHHFFRHRVQGFALGAHPSLYGHITSPARVIQFLELVPIATQGAFYVLFLPLLLTAAEELFDGSIEKHQGGS